MLQVMNREITGVINFRLCRQGSFLHATLGVLRSAIKSIVMMPSLVRLEAFLSGAQQHRDVDERHLPGIGTLYSHTWDQVTDLHYYSSGLLPMTT